MKLNADISQNFLPQLSRTIIIFACFKILLKNAYIIQLAETIYKTRLEI